MPHSFRVKRNTILNSINFVSWVPYTYAYKKLALQNWLSTAENLILEFKWNSLKV